MLFPNVFGSDQNLGGLDQNLIDLLWRTRPSVWISLRWIQISKHVLCHIKLDLGTSSWTTSLISKARDPICLLPAESTSSDQPCPLKVWPCTGRLRTMTLFWTAVTFKVYQFGKRVFMVKYIVCLCRQDNESYVQQLMSRFQPTFMSPWTDICSCWMQVNSTCAEMHDDDSASWFPRWGTRLILRRPSRMESAFLCQPQHSKYKFIFYLLVVQLSSDSPHHVVSTRGDPRPSVHLRVDVQNMCWWTFLLCSASIGPHHNLMSHF